ncbi:MAG TPA: thioredoxin domain-containing protein [Polyangiaceae bacterium]|jgi:protein-disulfide isomerase|nr:thioredoxin domain-containing protein [Polyangiaceae bacterium]
MSSKDTKDPHASAADAGGGTNVNTGVAIVGFLLCFLAGVALMWGYDQHRLKGGEIAADTETAGGAWDDSESPVPISSKNPMWGKRDAPVTIVQYSDFQCPYCSRVEPTMDQVRQAYGPDKVRIVWRNNPLPFHQNAKPAAEAAQGVFALAGNDGFWKFHDTAFKNQGALGDDSYPKWATDAGVKDAAAFKAGLASHKWADAVDKDLNDGKAAGVQGTPSFFVNGVFINGAQPFDSFKKTIDQELEKAQAKIASGTPKAHIYVEMSKENKKNAPAAAKNEDEGEKEDTTTVFKVPVGSSPVLGSPNALVTIVEFSDFQCPFCSRVEPTLKGLRDKYGDKVRLVWKNEPLPFHPAAGPAAEAAMEVRAEKGDKGFWDAHDKFFGDQKDLVNGQAPNIDAIVKMAAETGASADKIKKAVSDQTHKKEIDADQDLSEDFQASGTPHFFVNGRRLVGAQPQEKFEKIIDEEITKAQALIAAGTKPSDVYAALTKDGKGPPEPEKKDLPKSLPTNDPARGAMGAKVTIHEWSDFQCPFCGRVEPTVAQVMKDYGERVKFVWHDMPLPMHADAPLAAQAGREAYAQKGPTAFWSIHDKMFANQQKIKRDDLDGYAKDLNLNMDKWKSALDGSTHTSEIEADKKSGNDDGISGTPAFIIVPGNATSGYFVNGAQAYPKFRKLIERALSEASK